MAPATIDALVTGATGFVGANVARELLREGATVRVLARPNGDRRAIDGLPVEVCDGDLVDPASVRRAVQGARTVFHVAADYRLWAPRPEEIYRANVEGTRAVLQAAADRPDGRGLLARTDVRDARHRAQHRPRPGRRARPSPGRRTRPGRREVHPWQRQSHARRDRRAARRDRRQPRSARPDPVRRGLARRRLHGGRGARHRLAAAGVADRGAHGPQAHVLQLGQGRARARTAANRRPDGAPRGDRVVRRAPVRRAPAEDRVIGHLAARLTRKSRSNFYYAFLALPKPRRDALYAVYAFCRTVDDIADLGAERGTDRAEQRRALDRWRADVALCYEPSGAPTDPIAARLAQAVQAFAIPREALLAIIDGVAMDLDRVRYETAEDLYPYCYRVAAAVGLCCIEIFGYTDPRARQYAVDLGTAL